MINYMIINDKQYELRAFGNIKKGINENRPVVYITIDGDYEFVKGLINPEMGPWGVKTIYDDDTESYKDLSKYVVPCSYLDNNDGSFSVHIGKLTEMESLIETIYGGIN